MYAKVAQTIQRFQLLSLESPVIVGVSGGADSLSLLDCLKKLGYPIVAAHLNHHLREESGDEATYVQELCQHYNVECVVKTLAKGELSGMGGSIEEAARLERYNFLGEIAHTYASRFIAVGHTADDQVETVIMHFLRGAGPAGLRGMLPQTRLTDWVGIPSAQDLELARPLLECSRAETVQHCQEQGLKPLQDPSNLDQKYFRNRIRHELLPLLETYNPRIREVVLRLSEVMRHQVAFNHEQLAAIMPGVVTRCGSAALLFDPVKFLTLDPFMQRAMIRSAILSLEPSIRDITHEATLRAINWFENQGGAINLPGDLRLEKFGKQVLLWRSDSPIQIPAYPQLLDDSPHPLTFPGEILLSQGWRIAARLEPINPKALPRILQTANQGIAIFDADEFPPEVVVRSREPGDRIQLPGLDGPTKVADLMINHKIPQQVRRRWPLVAWGEKVLWVPVIRRSDAFLVDGETTQAIVIQILPPGGEQYVETPV